MEKIYYEKLFPSINFRVPEGLFLTTELKTYSTPLSDSKKIIKIIESFCKTKELKNLTIIDATGGGGSDSISFCKYFMNVISIEYNKETFDILKNNINCYTLNNIQLIHNDAVQTIPKIAHYDIIYIDPPWGGSDYKNHKTLDLEFGAISLEKVIAIFFDENEMLCVPFLIVLKLPTNFNMEKMFKFLNPLNLEIHLFELKKKNICVIKKKE